MNRTTLLSGSLALVISAAAMASFMSSLPNQAVTTQATPNTATVVRLPVIVVTPGDHIPTLPVVHVHARDPHRDSALVGSSSFDLAPHSKSNRGSSSLHMPYYSFSNVY